MADISITASAVLPGSGASISKLALPAGVTVTQGQVLYMAAGGILGGLADSNGGSAGDAIRGTLGLCLACSAGSPLQEIAVMTLDNAGLTLAAGLTSGNVLYLSNVAGGITATYSDVASGSTVVVLGGVLTGGTVRWNPQTYGVK